MTVTLVTVADVPIVSTGTYQLASGEATFSAEDLADAVRAAQDPTVPAPRLKLGHTDPRFEDAVAAGDLDGEPAFGTVQNLRLSDDGQTVLGDYVDVPEWLADTLQSSYPGRSIEGGFGFTAPSGHSYRLVIARVALLGITWPGVTSLADLREVLEQNGQVQDDGLVEAQSQNFVVARIARPGDASEPVGAENGGPAGRQERAPAAASRHGVLAGLDLGNVRMQFCGDLDSGDVPHVPDAQPQADDVGPQVWWWPRSVRVEDDGSLCLIVDDDEGHLIRIPFTVQQADLIYGQPELVIEEYVPVTADPDGPVTARGHALAQWPIRAASRPSNHATEVQTMDVDPAVLRRRLGLPDDADEPAITEALEASSETETTVPDGMVLVDAETFAQVREGAQQGAQVAARLARDERERIITAAIRDGKFAAGRRSHYEEAWERDPDGTRTLLSASVADGGLASGLVPVGPELGRGGDGENDPAAGDAQHAEFMARHFPNETSRIAARSSRVRVRQEA